MKRHGFHGANINMGFPTTESALKWVNMMEFESSSVYSTLMTNNYLEIAVYENISGVEYIC